ncbi:MAG: carboxypeptidase regulatory-like domain-containing protein [Bacteroidia bacterium]|nr:carboxypeptidase regulatory-like domain-containing protein [Bacteroidia bacterium]
MKKIYSFLFALLALVIVANAQSQLGELRGKIIDAKTKKPLDYASITLELNGIIKAQKLSDDEGEYIIKPLQPGEYTIKVSYSGYQNISISGVTVVSDQIAYQNVAMNQNEQGKELETVVVKAKKKLIDPDNKSGAVISNPVALPQRSVNMIANTVAGVDARAGATPNIRGARADGTAYYIDGVRVQAGSVTVPTNAIDQIQVITGGTPAQYGDFTGGAITINTKAPSKRWSRAFEYITASPFYKWMGDNTHYNEFQGFISGPILLANKGKEDKERVLLGFSLGASAVYALDGRLPAVDLYQAKPDVQKRIEETPLTRISTGGFVPSGEFLTKSDLEKVDQRQNVGNYSINLQGNFSYQPTNNIVVRLGYQSNYSRARGFSFANSLLNSATNQMSQDFTGRVYGQFTQTFNKTGEDEKKVQTVSGFYYTARLSYERRFVESMDANFQDRIFEYGYIGTFKPYYTDYFTRVSKAFGTPADTFFYNKNGVMDTLYLTNYLTNIASVDTAYTFTPADINKIRGNYTKTIYDYFSSQGSKVTSLSQLRGIGGLVNGDNPMGIYSNMWSSPGTLQSGYSKAMFETYTLYLMSEASVAPKTNPKAKHDLQFGFTYEQQIRRSYGIAANSLWGLMRQLVSTPSIDSSNYTLKFDQFNNFQDTVLFGYKIKEQSNFDKELRKKLMADGAVDAYGNPITASSRIDVNSYKPSTYSLDMFTADELLNNGNSLISYTGYDYKGNKVSGKKSVNDFLNDPQNRLLAAYQPIYMAAWLQDKFVFKDLIVRAGVRFDRFDANQVVLKDPYSLVPVYSAGEVRSNNIRGLASSIPSTIGDKYVVYVDTKTPSSGNINITGFRNGNDWYDKNGNPVTDPSAIWRNAQMVNSNAPGQNIPLLVNDNAQVPTAASFKDYQPDVKVSPRISFSFPISTTSQFFGNYDVLVQRPTESNVAQIDDYFYLNNRRTGVVANPDLKMTQVTDYEIGFRQQIGDNSAIGLIASYREFRNLIQLYRFVEAYPFPYTAFGNLDFSTVKSFRVEYELRDLGNINLSANYALQFAEGTGSNSQSSSALIQVGLPTLRSVYPVSFDTRHTLKGTIDYHYKEGKEYDGPIVNGYKILENAGINFIFNYTSGRPYTETLTAVPEVQSGVVARSQVKGTINGSNLPPQFYIDMNIDKYFTFKKEGLDGKQSVYRLRAFIWVQNILNAANVLSVYSYTGSAYDDGYLASPQSIEQKRVATSSQSFVDLYNIRMVNPNFFALPRLTRLGVSFYF